MVVGLACRVLGLGLYLLGVSCYQGGWVAFLLVRKRCLHEALKRAACKRCPFGKWLQGVSCQLGGRVPARQNSKERMTTGG